MNRYLNEDDTCPSLNSLKRVWILEGGHNWIFDSGIDPTTYFPFFLVWWYRCVIIIHSRDHEE